ncbi:hypothetical protein LU635_06405 [Gramella sp. YB25]|uniref:Uncharacterized protein n=1 Tax=Christiangramia crocea TaxID=2904124 RepID=A0A9X2A5I5_9FLAO|nr:hypothetical protein [Gramella crocea]
MAGVFERGTIKEFIRFL